MEKSAIQINGLRVVRGRKEVLHHLTLTVPQGAVVGLLGPSGGGKSTLMRSIVGAQIIAGGTIKVFGHEAGTAPLRPRVGYVTQAPSVYGDLTVRQNLTYFGTLVGTGSEDVTHTIASVGLSEQADQVVDTLSGGQRSRVSLAAAILGHPDLLVLDEPTVGLDPALRDDLWKLFRRFSHEGTTILVSSHVMDEATRCDRLLFLREGRILADGTLDEITRDTHTTDAESAFLALARKKEAA